MKIMKYIKMTLRELLAYMIKEIMRDDLSRKNVYESFHKFTNNSNPKNKKYLLDLNR